VKADYEVTTSCGDVTKNEALAWFATLHRFYRAQHPKKKGLCPRPQRHSERSFSYNDRTLERLAAHPVKFAPNLRQVELTAADDHPNEYLVCRLTGPSDERLMEYLGEELRSIFRCFYC